jgi:hypothetical protein
MMTRTTLALALAAGCSLATAGNVLSSFSYTDLDGAFDSGTGIFSANAANNADLQSGGDVSKLFGGGSGTAQFDTGFFGLSDADVTIELEIFNITATSADATGIVNIVDTDGDTLSASIQGSWDVVGPFGFMFFNGVSSDYTFTDVGQQDGAFEGVSGAFSILQIADQLFDGALSIVLRNPGGFGGDFEGVSTQADGILIPTPGAIVIAGLGVAGMSSRRRRA